MAWCVPCRDRVSSARERAGASAGSGTATQFRWVVNLALYDAAVARIAAGFRRGSGGAALGRAATEAIRLRNDAFVPSKDAIGFGARVRPLLSDNDVRPRRRGERDLRAAAGGLGETEIVLFFFFLSFFFG